MFKKFFKKNKLENEKTNENLDEILEKTVTQAKENFKKDINDVQDVIENTLDEIKEKNSEIEKEVSEKEEKEFKQMTLEKEVEEKLYLSEQETIQDKNRSKEIFDEWEQNEKISQQLKKNAEIVEQSIQTEEVEKRGFFARLVEGLTKTKNGITDKIDKVLKSYTKIDEDLIDDIEEILITSDVGVNTTMKIIDDLKNLIKERGEKDPMKVMSLLKEIIEKMLSEDNSNIDFEQSPTIILMVGVNGVGKTTTIGKLAKRYKNKNKKVILAAADTFRAAATEQLDIWAQRTNVDIIKHQEGADPGAVVFDAVKAAKARKADVLICDTAGRLHNKANLMNELGKIFKIVEREFPEAKKEVLLVVDATTGQNAVSQAKTFKEVAKITGIVLTKLDGTAKGGVVLAVKNEVKVPVKLIGVGEAVEDLQDFDAKAFTEALFN